MKTLGLQRCGLGPTGVRAMLQSGLSQGGSAVRAPLLPACARGQWVLEYGIINNNPTLSYALQGWSTST